MFYKTNFLVLLLTIQCIIKSKTSTNWKDDIYLNFNKIFLRFGYHLQTKSLQRIFCTIFFNNRERHDFQEKFNCCNFVFNVYFLFFKVLELEQEKGEWGFKALKQMVKIDYKLVCSFNIVFIIKLWDPTRFGGTKYLKIFIKLNPKNL